MEYTEEQFAFMPGYFISHDGYRRDVQRLKRVAKNVSDYSDQALDDLYEWFKIHELSLTHHHHSEDEFFFPELQKKIEHGGGEIPDVSQLKEDHKKVDGLLEKINEAFKSHDQEGLGTALEAYTDLLPAHLDREEVIYVPLIMKYETVEEHHAMERELQKKILSTFSKQELMNLLAWMLEDMNDLTKKYFWVKLPLPPRLIYKLKAKKYYNSLLEKAFKALK